MSAHITQPAPTDGGELPALPEPHGYMNDPQHSYLKHPFWLKHHMHAYAKSALAQHAGEVKILQQQLAMYVEAVESLRCRLSFGASIGASWAEAVAEALNERDQLRAQLAEHIDDRSKNYVPISADHRHVFIDGIGEVPIGLPEDQAEHKASAGGSAEVVRETLLNMAPSPFAEKFDNLAGRGMHELRSDELSDYLAHVAITHGPLTEEFKLAAGWVVSELERKTNDERVLAVKLDRMRESMQSPASAGMVVVPDPLIQSQTRRQVTDAVEAHANGVVEGWNGCRAAMLASMQKSAGGVAVPEGDAGLLHDLVNSNRISPAESSALWRLLPAKVCEVCSGSGGIAPSQNGRSITHPCPRGCNAPQPPAEDGGKHEED